MNLSAVTNMVNFPIELENDTFKYCSIDVGNISFNIDKEREIINFYCELYPLKGHTIDEDIIIVFCFYTKNGKISKVEETFIYSESFFKIDIISNYLSFDSIDSLYNFINNVDRVKVYAKKR